MTENAYTPGTYIKGDDVRVAKTARAAVALAFEGYRLESAALGEAPAEAPAPPASETPSLETPPPANVEPPVVETPSETPTPAPSPAALAPRRKSKEDNQS